MSKNTPPQISVVIPAYFPNPNHRKLEEGLRRFLAQFSRQGYLSFEVLICDSGPAENRGILGETLERIVEEEKPGFEDKLHYVYISTAGPPLTRAEAMNLGVQKTSGDLVLFMHLDCVLPDLGLSSLAEAYLRGAMAGGFLKQYDGKTTFSPLQATERYLNWIRTVISRQMVGTNAIYMTRELAERHPYQGGFLEDVEMSDWIRTHVKGSSFAVIRKYVSVSANKYRKQGEFQSIAINAAVMTLYRLFDVRPDLLRTEIYRRRFPSGLSFWPTLFGTCWKLIRGAYNDEA